MYENQDPRQLGLAIKQARETLGLSFACVASALGISERHLARIENGTRQPSLSLFIRLAEILHLSVDQYLSPKIQPQRSTLDKQIDGLLEKLTDTEKRFIFDIIMLILKEKETEKR